MWLTHILLLSVPVRYPLFLAISLRLYVFLRLVACPARTYRLQSPWAGSSVKTLQHARAPKYLKCGSRQWQLVCFGSSVQFYVNKALFRQHPAPVRIWTPRGVFLSLLRTSATIVLCWGNLLRWIPNILKARWKKVYFQKPHKAQNIAPASHKPIYKSIV